MRIVPVRANHVAFSSPEAALLLVSTKNRDLWQIQRHSGFEWLCKHNRLRPEPIRFVRLDSRSMRRMTGSPWIADFRYWTWPEVAILGADQKERGLWGREWPCRNKSWILFTKLCLSRSIVLLSSGQTIATFQRNISQQCWSSICKHRRAKRWQHLNATDRNIVGRNMLHAFGYPVASCWDMLRVENRTSAHAWGKHCCTNLAKRLQHHATSTNFAWKVWPFSNLSQQHSTCRNTSQQCGQTHATCCDRLAGL